MVPFADTLQARLARALNGRSRVYSFAAGGPVRPPRPHMATPEELIAHAALLDTLSQPLWRAAS